jgi:hypothetical protein
MKTGGAIGSIPACTFYHCDMNLWHTVVFGIRPWHLILFAIAGFVFFYHLGTRRNSTKR